MKYIKITYPDINNGLGCRCTLWISGCTHHCKDCHNKFSWDFNVGKIFTDDDKNKLINLLKKDYINQIDRQNDKIEALKEEIANVNNLNNKLQEKMDKAYAQIKELATKTVESAGGVKIIGNNQGEN